MRKSKKASEKDPRAEFSEQREEYEIILGEQKNVILSQKEQVKKLTAELEAYKNRENLADITLKTAERRAAELKKLSEREYAAEMRRLTEFKKRWDAYFAAIRENKGGHKAVKDGEALIDRLGAVLLKNASDREKILNVAEDLSRMKPAAEDAAQTFALDMSEVLNPGELDLEELCKEMGLMEE